MSGDGSLFYLLCLLWRAGYISKVFMGLALIRLTDLTSICCALAAALVLSAVVHGGCLHS
jgi:hypothetical protein